MAIRVEISLIMVFVASSALILAACGEETPCEKARGIQARICRESNSEKCYPCPCILRGQDYTFATDEFGLPDLDYSECINPWPCEGIPLTFAEGCIEDEQTCDPRYFGQIKLFDNGEPEPGFEGICDGDW